ncbi:YidH family protein [Nocardia carnea]|uniref:YidH family protein n=1 Tax=Nocardia carnea TaxID=37328 RepID=A0ABW7TX67_9NOCA|nr:DUF202 domain-containing protein [Nocardia carnea]
MSDTAAQGPAAPLLPEPDYRFTLANERTFLAWQRTSLGLLAAAVAALHLLPGAAPDAVAFALGGLLGSAAVLSAAGGLLRWRSNDRAIRHDRPLPTGRLTTALAAGLAAVGVVVVIVSVAASLTMAN